MAVALQFLWMALSRGRFKKQIQKKHQGHSKALLRSAVGRSRENSKAKELNLTLRQPTGAELSLPNFSKKYFYSDKFDSDRDRVVAIAKQARKNQSRIHLLVDDEGTQYGFIALSIAVLDEKPSLVIDYLFISEQFRGLLFKSLNGLTLGKFLLAYAIDLAETSNRNFPLEYIALEPANARLEKYYSEVGYRKLDGSNFMFLRHNKRVKNSGFP